MKYLIGIVLLSLFTEKMQAQEPQWSADSISLYFKEVKKTTFDHIYLWGKDIYGPVILVDTATRQVYANQQDSMKILTKNGDIYTGILPPNIGFSNTSLEWSGTTWAMVTLPLPENKYDRTDLIVHELFHSAQPSLGFNIPGTDNNHLDRKDGRVYLRLELAALEKALKARTLRRAEEHLQNALVFRKYRHLIYRGSETTENRLDLLEGLATYTGQIMSGRSRAELEQYLIRRLESFKKSPTFVRSFAYETVPVYGFFLSRKDDDWNRDITMDTDLTEYFSDAFGLSMRIVLHSYVNQVAEEYDGEKITREETERGIKNELRLEDFEEKFFDLPHLEIALEKMNLAFDPKNPIPLDDDQGTIYPTARITDNWGILTVTKGGVLLGTTWKWAIVSEPLQIDGRTVSGDGWILELSTGYSVEKDKRGNYSIVKEK